jgi:hypothetical protein
MPDRNKGASMKLVIACLCTCVLLAGADEVANSFPAPSSDITGLAWGNNYLWAVDTSNRTVYQLNPGNGSVVNSFTVTVAANHVITGLAFYSNSVYIGADWPGSVNSGYVYRYSTTGSYQGVVDVVC